MKIELFVYKIHQFEPNTGKNTRDRCDPIQSPLLRISTPAQLDWPSHTFRGSTLWGMEGRSWYQTFWLSKKRSAVFQSSCHTGKMRAVPILLINWVIAPWMEYRCVSFLSLFLLNPLFNTSQQMGFKKHAFKDYQKAKY